MTLSRPRRIATGIAAGAIVLCAALLGASFQDGNSDVSVASEARDVIPVPEFDDDELNEATEDAEASEAEAADDDNGEESVVTTDEAAEDGPDEALSDPVQVIEEEDLPDSTDASDDDGADDEDGEGEVASDDDDNATDGDPADDGNDAPTDEADTSDTGDTEDAPTEDDGDGTETVPGAETVESAGDASTTTQDTTPPPAADPPAPPPVATGGLGTGGGVNDAECGLDRLVIYAGAPVGGVAGRLRGALASAGFGAGCQTPVTVLAANCPLQFSGVLPAGSGYNPGQSFVASSPNVDRDSMTAILGTIGYTGSGINILPFGFAQADKPGERWMAIFVPPSFAGWEGLAGRAGLSATSQSLCGPTGRIGS